MELSRKQLKKRIAETMMRRFGCEPEEATQIQFYKTVCLMIREMLADQRSLFAAERKKEGAKQVYYMSMEFLTGPSLKNHVYYITT